MDTVDPCIGRSIGGKFVIEALIGTGAMGSVYLARHSTLDTRVAIKVMLQEMAKDQTFAERFLREARAASRLDHPNVIRVRDFGTEPDGLHYLVMEYVDGFDLGQLVVREFPMATARIVDILSQVLSATAAAHAVGIVHRDLKPENVLVSTRFDDDGRRHEVVKVCDFGIAQMNELPRPGGGQTASQRPLTLSGVLLGTPQYMSPEQCRGEVLDARSDLYSVGVMLYELLAGRAPFLADNYVDIVVKHVSEEPVPPSALYPEVPPGLEQACLRALRKRREERFASAREMRAAIRAAIGVSDDLSGPHFLPELRSSVPGLDTQPSFSSRVPASRLSPNDVPTLLFPEGPPAKARRPAIVTLRYVLGATLIAIAALVIVLDREGEATSGMALRAPAVAPSALPALVPTAAPRETVAAESASVPSAATLLDAKVPSAAPPPSTRPHRAPGTAPAASPPHEVVPAPRVAAEPPVEGASTGEAAPRSATPGGAPRPEPPAPSIASATATAPARVAPVPPDPSRANVGWQVASVGGGATAGGVSRALSRAAAAWTECYRSGLRARAGRESGAPAEGAGTLRIACDDQGRVVEAKVSGFGMPGVARCLEQRAMGATIPNADTGEAWSTISLSFKLND